MTAQQAPHSPPLWRRLLSLPKTVSGWWAVGLASPALGLIAFTNVEDPLLIFAWLLSALTGGAVGLIACYRDRSLLVLVAQVPVVIIFAYLIWGIGSMSIGHDANVWVTAPIAVLLWAVMILGIWRSDPEKWR